MSTAPSLSETDGHVLLHILGQLTLVEEDLNSTTLEANPTLAYSVNRVREDLASARRTIQRILSHSVIITIRGDGELPTGTNYETTSEASELDGISQG